jgi:hypothetical protein
VERGGGLLCVVGKTRLVWLEPRKAQIAAQHACLATVVGLPRLQGDCLLTADTSGRIDWLDIKAGFELKESYVITPQAAAVGTPLVLAGRLIVAMSDGTLLIGPRVRER